ncbi:MAG TPA: hypothetical protein VNX21_04455 [Candidatus Thermoplasmatota archaeon]|nr:hypothetical protein [Candidatus Thermoplasmatota archaeon]
MRLLTTLLVLGLALGAFATAPAQAGGPDHAPDAHPPGEEARENRTANASALRERHAALVQARHAALDAFHENRTRILAEHNATLHAIKASFLENKTKVLEDCRAARNQTSGNATAKCVSDGLKPLIEKARADIAAAREAAQEALREARAAAVAKFHAEKAHVNARHGRPTG